MPQKKQKSTQKKSKLMVIDGNAIIHRSFHALPLTMRKKDGTPVNAVYGYAAFLIKAIRELRPEYVVLTLDKKGPTFRHKKFKEYKAKRVKAPDELYSQIPLVRNLTKSFNIPIFEKSGFEADDLIGTIAKKAKEINKKDKKKIEAVIVTGDKDTLQLVDEEIKVYSMSRGISESILYDQAAVFEKIGVKPSQIIDYKALRGDPSDNIPGVPGIGGKTAVELIKIFQDLDKVYANVERNSKKAAEFFKPRVAGLLLKHKKEAYLSRELAEIKCDVPIDFNLEKTRFSDLDKEQAVDMLSELEFKSLLPRVRTMFQNHLKTSQEDKEKSVQDKFTRNREEFKYHLVEDGKKFELFLSKLKGQRRFSFDTETSGFDPFSSVLLGVSFSWKKGEAYYVKLNKDKVPKKEKDNLFNYRKSAVKKEKTSGHPWLAGLRAVFENDKIKKNAHNAKFDIKVLKANGIEARGLEFDTMIASYLLSPGTRGHGLDSLSFSEFGFEKISKTDLLGGGREKIGFDEVPDEKISLYSCEDADFTHRLWRRLGPKLKEQKMDKLFYDIEAPLVYVLADMEKNGVEIDPRFLSRMGSKMDGKIRGLEKNIHKKAGIVFNIRSPQQLKEILFDKLEIPADGIKKTKTGISTAADELEKLKGLHPVIRLILDYRELFKLKSAYIDALPKLINRETGRVHTHFNQTITATGRLSSTDPNLQNIPVRTELGREIRKAFTSPKGRSLLAFDYSQIELRLAASMSGDKKMIKAFKNGADIHSSTAAEINQVSFSVVDREMRREAKAVNFGILYGQGPHGLSRSADIPYFRAKEFIDNYFAVYKDIKKYIESTIKQAVKKGYVETLFGRRRYLPDINSSVAMVRKAAERMAINTPLQGTAADMLKAAMIRIYREVCSSDIRMIMTVHDELIFEIKDDKITKAGKKIKDIMENIAELEVPIVVDAKKGDNWGEMSKIDF